MPWSLARVLAHIPNPKRHIVRYYGTCSNPVRGKQKARVTPVPRGRVPVSFRSSDSARRRSSKE